MYINLQQSVQVPHSRGGDGEDAALDESVNLFSSRVRSEYGLERASIFAQIITPARASRVAPDLHAISRAVGAREKMAPTVAMVDRHADGVFR